MKAFGKELFSVHLDPIQRDLLVVFALGLVVAAVVVSVGFVIFH